MSKSRIIHYTHRTFVVWSVVEAGNLFNSPIKNSSQKLPTGMAPLIWLVTGCSSGFGEQFVYSIIARGDKVIASGRNAATRLQHLESTGAHVMDLDVTLPPQELDAKVQAALAVYGGIDVLVNNAGYIESSPLEELGYVWYTCFKISRAPLIREKPERTEAYMLELGQTRAPHEKSSDKPV